MNHTTHFTNVCAHQITGICAIIQYLKKACLTILCLKWLQLLLLEGGTAENREHDVEGRGFLPHVLIYFECQKNI